MRLGERMKKPRNSVDILSKHLSAACPGDVLSVLGLHDAHIVRALPTELDEVIVRQQFMDIVFEQASGSLLHLEFQSTPPRSLYRFLGYDLALAEHFRRKIRTVVLYSGNVQDAKETLDAGTIQYHVENLYLNQLDGDAALEIVKAHLQTQTWTPEDRVRLAFAMQMRFTARTPEEAFEEVLRLTQQVPEKDEQNYVTALIFGLSGKGLSEAQREQLKGRMRMTDLIREIEQEALEKGLQEGRQAGRQEGRQEGLATVAERMFRKGASLAEVVDMTGLSQDEAKAIQDKLVH
jgi:predicted transposase/invertase (TIGR01784 family)